ncbi:MAG: 1-acylglycerol-3-phosphate O-acyltransferase [Spirochaetes bacterium]|nr:1-acylglycerol-3-phosphate O-acyltransferase [Spirochaetota bacterium]
MIINFIITLYFYEFLFFSTLFHFVFAVLILPFPFLKKYLHLSLSVSTKNILLFISGSTLKYVSSKNPSFNTKKPVLIVCNHQSLFDILVIFSIFANKLRFSWVIKKSLFNIPFFGTVISTAGYIKLDRKNKYKAYKAIKKAIHTIKKNISVAIFPEGTRSLSDTIQEFKSGSMVIATNTGVPILPVILKNTLYINQKGSFLINPQPIKIKILEPIMISSKMKKDQNSMLLNIRKKMLKEYNSM